MDESRPAAVDQDPLPPLPVESAARAVLRCVGAAAVLLFRRRIRLPRRHLGRRVHFADGTTGVVYRETIADGVAALEPCTLLVTFRLRGIRGWAHAAFRAESLLKTPLFVGFRVSSANCGSPTISAARIAASTNGTAQAGERLRPSLIAGAGAGQHSGVDPLRGPDRNPPSSLPRGTGSCRAWTRRPVRSMVADHQSVLTRVTRTPPPRPRVSTGRRRQ